MIKVPASVRVCRWCWQLLVLQAKQCLEQTFNQTHQNWCCWWWFSKDLQCPSSCSFFMVWYYNILIIASYIVKDPIRSWEGSKGEGRAMKRVLRKILRWGGGDGVLNPRLLHDFPASALMCGHLSYWIRALAEWVTKNKTKQQQHKIQTSSDFWSKGSKVELQNGIQSAQLFKIFRSKEYF